MGVLVDVIKEVESRLNNEIGAGLLLEDVKNVFVGKRQNMDMAIDCPFLIIVLEAGNSEQFSGQKRKVSDLNISINIIDRLVDEKAKNLYFNSTTGKGILYLAEKVLDVIHSNGTTFDPRLNQNSFESMSVSLGGIEKISEAFLSLPINLTLKTREYIGNERRN